MTPTSSFSKPDFERWLKEEVATKLGIAAGVFATSSIPSYLIGNAVAVGIQPFLYWQRDHAQPAAPLPAAPSLGVGQPAGASQPAVAGSLSNRLANKDEHALAAKGIEWDAGANAYVNTGRYLQPDAWSIVNQLCRSKGLRWETTAKGWVRQ